MISKVIVNSDGGARGNPGPAAIGVLVRDDKDQILEEYKECVGNSTNNIAEYKGLIKALILAAKYTRKEVQVFMDSEFVVKQVTGEYSVKTEHILPLFAEVKALEKNFEKVVYTHVRRGDNFQARADKLVNAALDGK